MTSVPREQLITGVAGQDGVLLARLLRHEGVPVVGTVRPGSGEAAAMAAYLTGVEVVEHDVRDLDGFRALVTQHRPAVVYNLAAASSVGRSWAEPALTMAVNGEAVVGILAALEDHPDIRFVQASSAEIWRAGAASPYARAKLLAHEATRRARESGRFCSAAVLHVHESPLRPPTFVMRKVSRAVAEIAEGRRDTVTLGNLDARRDWGSAVDSVRALRLLASADEPAEVEVCTGVLSCLRDLVAHAFATAGIADPWAHVELDAALQRPADGDESAGDPEPVRRLLGWTARTPITETITQMVATDRRRLVTGVEEDPAYLAEQLG